MCIHEHQSLFGLLNEHPCQPQSLLIFVIPARYGEVALKIALYDILKEWNVSRKNSPYILKLQPIFHYHLTTGTTESQVGGVVGILCQCLCWLAESVLSVYKTSLIQFQGYVRSPWMYDVMSFVLSRKWLR